MAEFAIFNFISGQIDRSLISTVTNRVEQISAFAEKPVTAMMLMYFVIYGWMILKGAAQEPISELLKRSLKLAVIWYLIVNPLIFMDNFGNFLLVILPRDIIQAITGLSGDNSIDLFVRHGFRTATKLWEQADWYEIGTMLLVAFIYIVAILAGCVAFVIFAMSNISVAMLLILAPIFISLLMFQATSRWFWGWISAAVTFVILKVLLVALLTLMNEVAAKIISSATGWELIVTGWNIIIVYFIGFFIFFKLYDIAAAIGGGVSTNVTQYVNSTYRVYSSYQQRRATRVLNQSQAG
ncbi:MAG TPA: type IV secretion system protein [Alphaproteobacteria bacterium]|nr:type IV secretion system protein [Alphaproteobacteria bacterium]